MMASINSKPHRGDTVTGALCRPDGALLFVAYHSRGLAPTSKSLSPRWGGVDVAGEGGVAPHDEGAGSGVGRNGHHEAVS